MKNSAKYQGKLLRQVKCNSGIKGWRPRIRNNYKDYKEFCHYCTLIGLATRLGYKSRKALWEDNPIVEGSVIPSDYRKVSN